MQSKSRRFIYGCEHHLPPEILSSGTFGLQRHVALLALFQTTCLAVSQAPCLRNPQNSETNSNKSSQFGQVSSCILELCCGHPQKTPNDLDRLVIRLPCTFYIAGFVCIHLFYWPYAQRSGLGIAGRGQLHFFCKIWTSSVGFSSALGTEMGTLQ